MPSDSDWARAYAAQALSDLEAREVLLAGGADLCHRLHYLQMAAEKVCKAHLVLQNGEESVRKIHGYIASVLPIVARNALGFQRQASAWQLDAIRRFAREIEVLAPACHEEGTRPDNSEYPWQDAQGRVRVPCEYDFPGVNDQSRIVVTIIQILRTSAEAYL